VNAYEARLTTTSSSGPHCNVRSTQHPSPQFRKPVTVQVNQLASRMLGFGTPPPPPPPPPPPSRQHRTYGVRFDVNLDLKGSGPYRLVLSHPTLLASNSPPFAVRSLETSRGYAKVHVACNPGKAFPWFTQISPGEQSAEGEPGFIRLMHALATYSVLFRPLSASPAASARAPRWKVARAEGQQQQREKDSSPAPRPWPGHAQTACPWPPAPAPRRGNRPVQPAPQGHPPGNSRPPLLPLGRPAVNPAWMQPFKPTLTLAPADRACLKQLQASQATGNNPLGQTQSLLDR